MLITLLKKIFSAPGWRFTENENNVICEKSNMRAVCKVSDDALIIQTNDPVLQDDIFDEFGGIKSGAENIINL